MKSNRTISNRFRDNIRVGHKRRTSSSFRPSRFGYLRKRGRNKLPADTSTIYTNAAGMRLQFPDEAPTQEEVNNAQEKSQY